MTVLRIAALGALLISLPAFAQESPLPSMEVPDWAIPGSATHKQVPPPPGFHRETLTFPEPLNGFTVSEIGAPLVRGSSKYADGVYTVTSAGYNVWYTRDEFRYLWKQMKGDVSLAADIAFPDPNGYGDRKAVLVIRQDLEDDSRQVVVALHGAGMIQLAQRPEKGALTKDREFRVGGRGRPEGKSPDSLINDIARRIGIEKRLGSAMRRICRPITSSHAVSSLCGSSGKALPSVAPAARKIAGHSNTYVYLLLSNIIIIGPLILISPPATQISGPGLLIAPKIIPG